MEKLNLTGMLPEEISAHLPQGKEKYRGMQIFRWIYERGAHSFEEMTNLSKDFRAELMERFTIQTLTLIERKSAEDGSTEKFLWELSDGKRIESVIIRDADRVTVCISSQVGCKMGCLFCRTGDMGFIRNLTAGEILDQIIEMRALLKSDGADITNIVFMGMGDPLDNLDATLRAIKIITSETGLSIGQRRITVSTCGIIPGMIQLGTEFKRIGLAISLNAPDDKLRSKLMPINKRYPLAKLLDAVYEFSLITKRRVTFEYILIDGVNDSPEHAKKFLAIIRKIPSKVNLIAFNEFKESPFKRPSGKRIEEFQKILFGGNVQALLRKSKGTDICAACGQLATASIGEREE